MLHGKYMEVMQQRNAITQQQRWRPKTPFKRYAREKCKPRNSHDGDAHWSGAWGDQVLECGAVGAAV